MKTGGVGVGRGKAELWQHEQRRHKLKKDPNSYKDTKRNFIIIIIIIFVVTIVIISNYAKFKIIPPMTNT